jgi:D-serine deaminase-like pyridoxal phosphate-dependent protein
MIAERSLHSSDGLERLRRQAPLHQVQTPALVVDLATVDENIRLASMLTGSSSLRPHFKAHKCSRLLERQLAAERVIGVTCATVQEATVAAGIGASNILLANEIADPRDACRLACLARSATVTVAVDALTQVDLLAAAAQAEAGTLGVLIDIDVGQHRCGVPAGSPLVIELAQAVASKPQLRFDGIMGYDGHAQTKADEERAAITAATAQTLSSEDKRLRRGGFFCRAISGGGTGNLTLAASRGVLTEIQAGSYVLMDGSYAVRNLGFSPALFCLTTVISRRSRQEAVADAGLKALAVDEGLPQSTTPEVTVVSLSDEHATLRTAEASMLTLGDRLLLLPQHIDPTVNLHDALFVWTGLSLERWPVDARRSSE